MEYATEKDASYWASMDDHIAAYEFSRKVRDHRCYIIRNEGAPVGILRYNLFWDNTPFLTLIFLNEDSRQKGLGKQAMRQWEDEMRGLGYRMVMTSTQADEQAQHFYRKIGYKDAGCLMIDNPPLAQPLEILLTKAL